MNEQRSDETAPSELPLVYSCVGLTRLLLARFAIMRGVEQKGAAVGGDFAYTVARWLVPNAEPGAQREQVAVLDQEIEIAERRLRDAAATSPLQPVCSKLRLGSFEWQALALLIAIEVEPILGSAVQALAELSTVRLPDVGTVAHVVCGTHRERLPEAYAVLAAQGALLRYGLVVVSRDGAYATRQVAIARRVIDQVLGCAAVDEAWRDCQVPQALPETGQGIPTAADAERAVAHVLLPPEEIAVVRAALAVSDARLVLTGRDGIGKAWAASTVLAAQGYTVLRIAFERVLASDDPHGMRILALVRESALRSRVALVLDAGAPAVAGGVGSSGAGNASHAALVGEPSGEGRMSPGLLAAAQRMLADFAGPVVLAAPEPSPMAARLLPSARELALGLPAFPMRYALWAQALATYQVAVAPETLEVTASRYTLGGGYIFRAVARLAEYRTVSTPVAPEELADAARYFLGKRLGHGAELMPTAFTWADLVLPPEQTEALHEVVRFANLRAMLLEQWGFASKLPYGRGISVLLSGPPGTGKTMVAQVLAKEMGYNLFRIDLSQLVNKYIGETEKNLARIFEEAESSQSILFFDEADSMFAKRTEVKSSNDRYANLEVNYLLQRMESYDGVTVLATNLEQGLDDAFKRRIRFLIHFEIPDAAERERLWRSMLPAQAPHADDIDWERLASQFEITGAYIKRAVLRAALAAASRTANRSITQADLLAAARAEYAALGRVAGGL